MKRSPMSPRRTPMARTAFVSAGVVSADPKPRRGRLGTVTARLAASRRLLGTNQGIVLDRDDHRCILCGSPTGLQVHHRLPRGAGGSSRNPAIHSPSNMVALCADDHAWVESHRDDARDMGLLVRRGQNPEVLPVLSVYGWVLLLPDGTRRPVTVEGVES